MSSRFLFIYLLLAGLCTVCADPVETRLPNARLITPQGDWLAVAPYPFTLAVRGDGKQIVIPSVGFPFSLNIIDLPGKLTRIPNTPKNDPNVQVHAGVAYSRDGSRLYDATGDSGAVDVLSTQTWKSIARYKLDGADSFAATLTLSADGRFLYVLDQGNWRVVIIDTSSGKQISSVPSGSNPFAVALSPDGKRLYVTNSGLFEYQLIKGVQEKNTRTAGIRFPPFGYPSKAARKGKRVEGHDVPGLGDENDVRGSSLWTYDTADPAKATVVAKLRLGLPIRLTPQGPIGGASPTGVTADNEHVYVTLSHKDVVAVVIADGKTLEREIELTPFSDLDARGHPLRGVMPAGITGDATRLFVTEAGINAVAVIDKSSATVLGHIPVGWYPAAAAISSDGKSLYVVNNKGKGAGPNGGANRARQYVGDLELGSLSTIPLPANLEAATARVIRNNRAAVIDGPPLPRVKHTFLIIRENRTFDEIFGDLSGADGDGKLARYGLHGWTREEPVLRDIRVTPNAHALAQRFATSDAFSTDGDVSADGHRWAVGMAPTPWMNLSWTSSYGGRRKGNLFSAAPGRRAMGGGADGPMPEDEPEFGSLWEHVANSGLTVRNYGEGLELEGALEREGMEPEGQRLILNAPVPQPVYTSTDRDYPTFNMGIPDQFRYEQFAKDFDQILAKGDAPAMIVIRLPNDHTSEPRPKDGYRYRASFVADNDLALGKMIELISHSAIWKDSAIFVMEDDSQDGADHVDAHRSPLLVIGPYIRKGFISHRHTSMPSVQKTIYGLLGLGSLNLEDALAADLGDMFTTTPDLTPYTIEAPDLRIFDPAKARFARPKNAEEARELTDMDDAQEIRAGFLKKQKSVVH